MIESKIELPELFNIAISKDEFKTIEEFDRFIRTNKRMKKILKEYNIKLPQNILFFEVYHSSLYTIELLRYKEYRGTEGEYHSLTMDSGPGIPTIFPTSESERNFFSLLYSLHLKKDFIEVQLEEFRNSYIANTISDYTKGLVKKNHAEKGMILAGPKAAELVTLADKVLNISLSDK